MATMFTTAHKSDFSVSKLILRQYTNPRVEQSYFPSVLTRYYYKKNGELTCVQTGLIRLVNLGNCAQEIGLQCILLNSGVSLQVKFEYPDAHYCTTVDIVNTHAHQDWTLEAVS